MTHTPPTPNRPQKFLAVLVAVSIVASAAACREKPPADRVRVSGQVEATDVQVAAQVGGRLVELRVDEGDRVKTGDLVARLDTADAELALARAKANLGQADAQLRLLVAGARVEDIRQAEAQVAASETDVRVADVEVAAARADVERFEMLLDSNSGSRKQFDDAVTRRDVASARAQGARDRVRAARETVTRLRAGSRREEVEAARARVTAANAEIATWQKAIADATVTAPITGIVSEKLAEPGELLQPRATARRRHRSRQRVGQRLRRRAGRAAAAPWPAGDAVHRRRRRRASPARSATSRRRPSSRRATCRPQRTARSWSTASRCRSTTPTAC